ncbi:MAG: hypothetical protein AAFZ09_17605, partial [Pseudomonadota bacterium]
GERSVGFSLPWIAAIGDGGLALGGTGRLQRFARQARWKVARVDSRPRILDLPRVQLPLVNTPPLAEGALIGALDRALGSAGGGVADWADTRIVEQAFVEAVDANGALLGENDAPTTEEWPLFLRSLLGLRAVLERIGDASDGALAGRVLSLHRAVRETGAVGARTVAVVYSAVPDEPAAAEPAPSAILRPRLRVLVSDGAPAEAALDGSGSASVDVLGVVGRQRAREIAGSLAAEHAAILLIDRDADGFVTRSLGIAPLGDPQELGAAAAPLRRLAEAVHPSAALGWPEAPDGRLSDAQPGSAQHQPVTELAPSGGSDRPVISTDAGFAGRSASFGLRARALATDAPPPFIASMGRVAFQRRTAM